MGVTVFASVVIFRPGTAVVAFCNGVSSSPGIQDFADSTIIRHSTCGDLSVCGDHNFTCQDISRCRRNAGHILISVRDRGNGDIRKAIIATIRGDGLLGLGGRNGLTLKTIVAAARYT